MKRRKIGLVGAGQIGGTLGHLIALHDLGDVVFVDISEGLAKGKALDLLQSAAISGHDLSIEGGTDFSLLNNCDAVIVTAGIPRKPGMSRDDLLKINASVIKTAAKHIQKQCPQAFVIVITNPLDVMVGIMQRESTLPSTHVVGMAGVLDAARYKTFLAKALNVSVQSIDAFVLGGHGDTMVPMPRYTTISGIPLEHFIKKGLLSQETLDSIIERTRSGGAEIVNLLQNGSAFYAPANAAISMLKSYFFDEKKVLPCAVYVDKAYGVENLYVGLPCVIGRGGVERILELDLTPQEQEAFEHSAGAVKALMTDVERLDV